jgi:hypothetical protein
METTQPEQLSGGVRIFIRLTIDRYCHITGKTHGDYLHSQRMKDYRERNREALRKYKRYKYHLAHPDKKRVSPYDGEFDVPVINI